MALTAGEERSGESAESGSRHREGELLALEIELGAHTFANTEDAWWHRQLSYLEAGIEALHDPRAGLAGDTVVKDSGWGVARRRAFASSIAEQSVEGERARRLWAEATRAIQSSPHYGGLILPPKMGLLPIGPDPDSGCGSSRTS